MNPFYNKSNNQGIGSDRLRRAIERNRRKVAQKTNVHQSPPSPHPSDSRPPFQSNHASPPFRPSPVSPPFTSSSPHTTHRPGPFASPSSAPASSPFTSRPSSFPSSHSPPFRPPSSSPNNASNWQSKMNTVPKKRGWFYQIITKLGWCVCLFLMARLIFAHRGVIDYYKRRNVLQERNDYLYQLKIENQDVIKEMKKIKTNEMYKKKLVRDRLGFISADEFLILFRKDSAGQSSSK